MIEFRQAHQIASARDTGVTIPTVESIWLFCTLESLPVGRCKLAFVVFVVDRAPWWS